ncbi:MAG TPA: hypothetical protein VHH90_03985 [Polyangia bacterium]|nr:hypothetical protein [Polyangia bacterium]
MRGAVWLAGLALAAAGCAPTIGNDPVPAAMQWNATPPRVPSPSLLVVNQTTGRIDFGLAGIPVPDQCAAQDQLPEAACEFDQYLQTLNGFPTTTTAMAPASAALDPTTLTLGTNVVALAAAPGGAGAAADVTVGFDPLGNFLTVAPRPTWELGTIYWFAVRGYDNGVRTTAGGPVVGSPTMSLLKQESPLDCGVTDDSQLDRSCPAYDLLLSQGLAPLDAAATLNQLEQARLAYLMTGAWDLVAAAGIPKDEVAVLWGFPAHTNSVVEISAPAPVPQVIPPNQIQVAVHGAVDAATVVPFVVRQQEGTIVVMDLDAVVQGDLVNGLPRIDAQVVGGDIVITAANPFPANHTIGLFFTNGLRDPAGQPLVASPVSVLLTLQGSLVDSDMHSVIAGVSDGQAAIAEGGRRQLQPLFDNAALTGLTGIRRDNLVYCFAFKYAGTP